MTILLIFQILGLISSVNAILNARTTQGAIAWVIGLNTFAIVTVPVYWFLGDYKFHGYTQAHRNSEIDIKDHLSHAQQAIKPFEVAVPKKFPAFEAIRNLTEFPFLKGNEVELLVDGQQTFDSMIEGINSAEKYILFQFYILRSDNIGNQFKSLLIQKAKEGLDVYVIYDALGSAALSDQWIDELNKNGVKTFAFNTRKGFQIPFRINFRNHRKIVVVDGKSSWIGGLNIGDDYLGQDPHLTPWRDTHLKITGPASLIAQYAFFNDWYWASKEMLTTLNWTPQTFDQYESDANPGNHVSMLASGPADDYETASLFYTQAINMSQERIWIATPYFVPDEATMTALRLALLKKLDVRIITPRMNDNWFVKNAAQVYLDQLASMGAKIYFYNNGFMHQKVTLFDDQAAVIGTANFDNRSFRLNFEISAIVANSDFAQQVKNMLETDIRHSDSDMVQPLKERSIWERLKAHGSALLSPLL